jgi:hypothetical protein
MDKMPKELLVLITSDLDMDDKLNCALVREDWYHFIKNSNLYQELKFMNTPDRCEEELAFFKENCSLGNTVTELQLERCLIEPASIVFLPLTLPKVKHLIWRDCKQAFRGNNFYDQKIYEEALKTGLILLRN